jgi:LCP family protein required for cell wall assembly
MTEDGSDSGASDNRRRRRRKPANEEGLRSLGDQIEGRRMAEAGGSPGPAEGAGTAAEKVPNEARLKALGDEMRRSGGRRSERMASKRRSRRRRLVRRSIVIASVILLVLVGSGAGYLWYITHDLSRIVVKGLSKPQTTGQEAGTENILLVGSTSRCALTEQNPAYGLCSQGVDGVNSDVIMILHADPAQHRLALLSIPRDLFIPNARSTGANKVDAGLYQGMTQLVAGIQEDFGIPIQHTVSLNFDQFADVVQALGGINMSFPMSVFDAYSGLNVHAAACVHLDGVQALQVVRARHVQYDAPGTDTSDAKDWPQEALSDLARIQRDHEFLRVLAASVVKHGLANPISDFNLINSLKGDLTFDAGWSVSNMAELAYDFHSTDINKVPQLTMPVAEVTDPDGGEYGDYIYEGGNYGEVEFTAEPQDQSAIDKVLGIGSSTDSMTGQPLPAPSSVSVSVENGTGIAGQAAATARSLSALGFRTVGLGNATPVGDVSETVVNYGSLSPTVEAAAERVMRSLSGAVVMAYDPGAVTSGAEVTVVTGTQFAVSSPAAPRSSTSSTQPAATTPTTAPSTSSSSAIGAASASTMGLTPWDPRACAPGSTPTAPVPNQT